MSKVEISNNSNIVTSRKSKYLEAIIDPLNHVASIPDDVVMQHVNRIEPLTEVLTNDLGDNGQLQSTFLLFRLNAPSSAKGAAWQYEPKTNSWVFYGYISVAQEISDNYNSARHICGLLQIENSTISTTNATLSGTCNAIVYEGAPSELMSSIIPYAASVDFTPRRIFEKILAMTSNPLDKVGNVKVSTGVAIRAMPYSFNLPYTRLDDPTPSKLGSIPVKSARITDGTQDLVYRVALDCDPNKAIGSGTLCSFNFDVFAGPISISLAFTFQGNVTSYDFKLYNPLYKEIKTYTIDVDEDSGTYYKSREVTFDLAEVEQPVAAVELLLVTSGGAFFNEFNILAYSYNGNQPGMNWPVAAILLDGMPYGSQTSLSGAFGYELIPNPLLKQNLPTLFSHYDPHEMNYVKHILANRDELGLRSVMPLNMVEQDIVKNQPIHNLDQTAEAFSWGSLLDGIKAVAVPALKNLFPSWSRAIDSGATFYDDIRQNVGLAATGGYALNDEEEIAEACDFGFDLINPVATISVNSDDSISGKNPLIEPTQIMDLTKVGVDTPVVLFPVVVMSRGRPIKNCMYACVKGDHRNYLPPEIACNKYSSDPVGLIIHGWSNNVSSLNPKTATFLVGEYTLLPIRYATRSLLAIPVEAPLLRGRSCEAAIYATCYMANRKMPASVYCPITGAINTTTPVALMPNIVWDVKRSYCNLIGFKLTGLGPRDRSMPIDPLIAELQPVPNSTTASVYYNTYPMDGSEIADASTGEELSLSDLGRMLREMAKNTEDRFRAMEQRLESRSQPTVMPTTSSMVSDRQSRSRHATRAEYDEVLEYEPEEPPIDIRNRERSMSVGRGLGDRGLSRSESIVSIETDYTLDDLIDLVKERYEEGVSISSMYKTIAKMAISTRVRGPSTEAAQAASRARAWAGIQASTKGKLPYEWFEANNYKGPSAQQMNYYKIHGTWPPVTKVFASDEYNATEQKGLTTSNLVIPAAVKKYAAEMIEAKAGHAGPLLATKFMKMACSSASDLKRYGYIWLDALANYVLKHKKMPDAAGLQQVMSTLVEPTDPDDMVPGLEGWWGLDPNAQPPSGRGRSRARGSLRSAVDNVNRSGGNAQPVAPPVKNGRMSRMLNNANNTSGFN